MLQTLATILRHNVVIALGISVFKEKVGRTSNGQSVVNHSYELFDLALDPLE